MIVAVLAALGVVGVLALALKAFLRKEKACRLPRGFSTRKFVGDDEMPKHRPGMTHRDGYTKQKVPEDLDAIVVGSGIGGLACAGLMSRAGKRVLVLEQHYLAGGCTHAFEDGGFEFDTGIHYIGNIHKRQVFFNLVCDSPLEWDKMGTKEDGFVYDEVCVGSKKYLFRAGRDVFVDDLAKRFPGERAAIEKYVELITNTSKKDLFFSFKIIRSTLLARVFNRLFGGSFFEHTRKTALEVVQSLTPNKDLQAALLGQFGDYGQSPSTESFFIHASVANHYLEGGFYPRGGSTEIATKIIPTIERAGGRVLVRKAVKSILLRDGRAVGVEMANGDQIFAPTVISACGVFNTYKKLLPPSAVPRSVIDRIDRIGPSCSMVYLFVGMEGTPEELKLRSANIWHWPAEDGDYDKMLDKFYADPDNAPIPMFIGFPCAKDSTWNKRFPGKSNSVILSMCKHEWFKKWEHKRQGHRGDDYDKLKDKFRDRILEEGLYHYYPQCRGKVVYTAVGTSNTFNHYIGSTEGEVYGMESHPDRFEYDDWLRPQTSIPGLFMTGQDICTLGVTGALMAGVLTAHSVLGYGGVVDLLSGRNLINDLLHVEGGGATAKKLE